MKRFLAGLEQSRTLTLVTCSMIIGVITGRFSNELWAIIAGPACMLLFFFFAYLDAVERWEFRKLLAWGQALWRIREDQFFSPEFWNWVRTVRRELGLPEDDEPKGPVQ